MNDEVQKDGAQSKFWAKLKIAAAVVLLVVFAVAMIIGGKATNPDQGSLTRPGEVVQDVPAPAAPDQGAGQSQGHQSSPNNSGATFY